jgi:hypothetical protein
VWIGFADVVKAYDNVQLDQLDKFIRLREPDALIIEEWEQQFYDMSAINMDINGYILKRTKGLPQGSELAPALFNFYTTCILEELQLKENTDVAIFADNWVFKADTREDLIELMVRSNELLKTFGMEFNTEEAKMFRTSSDGFDVKPEDETGEDYTFLGIKWHFNHFNVWFKHEEAKFQMPKWSIKPGYETIKLVKKFIVPKFRFYWGYLKNVSKSQSFEYLQWFKKLLRNWLQKQLICQNLPERLIREIIFPVEHSFPCMAHVLADAREYETRGLNAERCVLLERTMEMAKCVVNQRKKLGIYQATNLLFNNKDIHAEINRNPDAEGKPYKRSLMVIDILYKSILGENRISTALFRDQMNFAKKTRRKRTYKIFE